MKDCSEKLEVAEIVLNWVQHMPKNLGPGRHVGSHLPHEMDEIPLGNISDRARMFQIMMM